MFKSFSKNLKGRDFAVGDIHGNFGKLKSALSTINFNETEDRLFSVGDIIDYGPDSLNVLDWLSRDWFIPVRGNHEEIAINHVKFGNVDIALYRKYGGGWFLDLPREQQIKIVNELEKLPLAIEVETASGRVGLVHADSPFATWREVKWVLTNPESNSDQIKHLKQFLLWSRDRITSKDSYTIPDLTFLLVGHNLVDQITTLGNVIHLDTGASYSENDYCLVELCALS